MIIKRVLRSIVLILLVGASLAANANTTPILAAASSLRSVWPNLIEKYTTDTAESAPKVSFASSGLLSTQLLNGAPFELFLSADKASIDRLPVQMVTQPATVFAYGALHLVAPTGSSLSKALSLQTLEHELNKAETSFRLAIPNPAHAPYGQAAKEVLEHAGIWPVTAKALLVAENAAQSLQFVQSGAVDAAFVPRSLVLLHNNNVVSVEVDPDSYSPVEHTVVKLNSASPSALIFHDWLLSQSATEVLVQAGLRVSP